ncbi:MAG: YfhO family protein [Acidobacteriota bacterium]
MNPTWLYVAAVYALAVWLAKRGGVELRWRIAAFFYALVLVFLFRPMTQQYVNLPVDIVDTLPPWSHQVAHPRMSNPEMSDITLQIVPWAEQVREQWRSMRAPLWNERSGAGYPLLANGQSAALSPLRLTTLPLTLGNAFTAEAAMKLLIALTFTFLFCRRRGYAELPSAIAAISFGFCTFLQVWLHFPLVTVAAMLPAAMYQIDLLAERTTYRRFVCTAGVWTAMILGGHPETVSHISFLAGIYLLWIVVVEEGFGRRGHEAGTTGPARAALVKLSAAAGAIAVAALLAMPLLAPLAEAIPRSKRYQELKVQPNEIGYFSDHLSQIVLLAPNFFGHPPLERARGTQTSPESNTGFAGILGVAAFIALALRAFAQRRFREREFFFVLATVMVLGIMLAWPGISDLFHAVFKLAANTRLRLLFAWLLAIQAGAVLDLMLRHRPQSRLTADRGTQPVSGWPYLSGLAITAAIFLYLINTEWFPAPADKDTAMIAILPSMSVLALAALVPLFRAQWRELALMVVAVAVVGELWQASEGWNPTLDARRMYRTAPMLDALAKLRREAPRKEPFRVVGLGPVFFPNLAGVYGYEDIRAHDPMANGRYLGVLRVRDQYDPSRYFAKWTSTTSRTLDFLNVRYVLGDLRDTVEDTQRYRTVYEGSDGKIFENLDVLPRFYAARNVVLEFRREFFIKMLVTHDDWVHTALVGGKLRVDSDDERRDLLAPRGAAAPNARMAITSATPTDYRMHISAPRHTMIVSSVPTWPGWKIERAGRTLRNVEVNGAFLGFVVPPGENDVRVYYDPPSFKLGVIVSLLTLLGLIVAPWAVRRRAAGQPANEVTSA